MRPPNQTWRAAELAGSPLTKELVEASGESRRRLLGLGESKRLNLREYTNGSTKISITRANSPPEYASSMSIRGTNGPNGTAFELLSFRRPVKAGAVLVPRQTKTRTSEVSA